MLTSVLHFLMITLTISVLFLQRVEEFSKHHEVCGNCDCLTLIQIYPSELSECYYKVGKWLEITVTCFKDKNQ